MRKRKTRLKKKKQNKNINGMACGGRYVGVLETFVERSGKGQALWR